MLPRNEVARLRQLGRVIIVGIVGAGSPKRDSPTRAAELYTGPLFQAARRWAEACTDDWVILSAQHGLVEPSQILAPYSKDLKEMSLMERVQWGRLVADAILQRYSRVPVQVNIVAGEKHIELIEPHYPPRLHCPVRGLNMGERIGWFTNEARKGKRFSLHSEAEQ
jgi:hypothetical protein